MVRTRASNVQRLVATRMSIVAIPRGGGLADGIKLISSKERLVACAKDAQAWVKDAIQAVREAQDPNPWRNSSDEEIAQEILKRSVLTKDEEKGER